MKAFISFFCLILFLLLPLKADAHLGGGPPFLKVDGKDAQTNPYNQGQTAMTVSWDAPPDNYLVNKPVTFVIDVPELMKATTIPEEYAKDIKIRWAIATGDNFEVRDTKYEEGTTLVKTFTKPGSYLVIIEAKLPADTDYILIDTVQVNILPSENYALPFASVYIGTHNDDPKKNVLFVSDSTFDDSTKGQKFLWDFGDGALHEGATINRKMEKVDSMGIESIFHRVIDENGFSSDIGFIAEKKNDTLHFSPFVSSQTLPLSVGTYEQASERSGKTTTKLTVPQFIAAAVGVLAIVGGGMWFVLKKKKLKFW